MFGLRRGYWHNSLIILFFMAPPVARGQAPQGTATTVTATPQGALASTSVTPGAATAFHPSRVLVRFRGGVGSLPGSANAKALVAAQNLQLVDVPAGLSVIETVARYKADPNVIHAEPEFALKAIATTTTNPSWGLQWDMTNISAPA